MKIYRSQKFNRESFRNSVKTIKVFLYYIRMYGTFVYGIAMHIATVNCHSKHYVYCVCY